jgi:cell division protein FtsN
MTRKKLKKTYKKRARKTHSKRHSVVWLLGGMMIGLAIPSFFLLKSHSNEHQRITLLDTNEFEGPKIKSNQPLREKKPLKKEIAKKAQYDFYDLLSPDESSMSSKEEVKVNQFQLEIGKFSNFSDADELKARLVLMGFEVYILKRLDKKTSVYKVMTGPFESMTQASQMQKRLKENAIDSTLVVG